jgi:hypothetical protein
MATSQKPLLVAGLGVFFSVDLSNHQAIQCVVIIGKREKLRALYTLALYYSYSTNRSHEGSAICCAPYFCGFFVFCVGPHYRIIAMLPV